jgi:hypothetical protein
MNAEFISMIAGILLSLLFSYVPGASDWYGALDGVRKRLVMLVLLFLAAAGAFALSCAGIYDYVACSQAGAVQAVEAFIAAVIANQTTYLVAPKPAKG